MTTVKPGAATGTHRSTDQTDEEFLMTNHTEWIQTYKTHFERTGQAYNDAENYGVSIHTADIRNALPGSLYWRIVGIHHLLPEENLGQRVILLDTVDEFWRPLRGTWVKWTWEGMRDYESADPVHLDKPLNEPGSNIALINVGMIVFARCTGFVNPVNLLYEDSGGLSDWGMRFHTLHGDEPLPDGSGNGNYTGHHSYHACWQRVRIGEIGPPDPEPEPEPPPTPVVSVGKAYVHMSQADRDYFENQTGEGCDNRPKVHPNSDVYATRPDGKSTIELIIDAREVAKLAEGNTEGYQLVSLFMPLFRDDPEA